MAIGGTISGHPDELPNAAWQPDCWTTEPQL
jgi:hypothetical protein